MNFVRSKYLIISEPVFVDTSGRRARLAYSARQATLFALDEATADALEKGGVIEPEQERLVELNALVADDEDEKLSVLQRLRQGSSDPGVRGFTILVSSYCNMGCGYCGQEHEKSAVDWARLDRLAERVESAIADPRTHTVNVTWFGGEPLLALRLIREMSARFVTAAKRHGKTYSAQVATNGSLLSVATLRMLHFECKLETVEITLDGPREMHDRRRRKHNGTGSFDHIVKVLRRFVDEGVAPELQISLRVNVDNENEAVVPELIRELAAQGLAAPQIELHPVPVHSWGNDVSNVELGPRHYASLEADWLRLAQSLGFGFGAIPTVLKRTTCRATSVYGEVVDIEDRIYACSEHPLVPGEREAGVVGRVSEIRGPRPLGRYDNWYDEVETGDILCGTCPLLPVCGGACPKLWREGHVPCPSLKFNWDTRVELAAAQLGFQPVAG